ncbi:MAG: hypothetical protein RL017_902 [Pseudomonadota bacterium]|jgi:hypothetical protein
MKDKYNQKNISKIINSVEEPIIEILKNDNFLLFEDKFLSDLSNIEKITGKTIEKLSFEEYLQIKLQFNSHLTVLEAVRTEFAVAYYFYYEWQKTIISIHENDTSKPLSKLLMEYFTAMTSAWYHFGIARGLMMGIKIGQYAFSSGSKQGVGRQAKANARKRNKEPREWIYAEFMKILADKSMLTDKKFGWKGKFSRNRFCKEYLAKVNSNFKINTNEETIRKWINEFIKENPSKVEQYYHLL